MGWRWGAQEEKPGAPCTYASQCLSASCLCLTDTSARLTRPSTSQPPPPPHTPQHPPTYINISITKNRGTHSIPSSVGACAGLVAAEAAAAGVPEAPLAAPVDTLVDAVAGVATAADTCVAADPGAFRFPATGINDGMPSSLSARRRHRDGAHIHHGSPRSVIHVHKSSMTPHHPQGLLWLQLPALTSRNLLSLSLVLLLGLWSRQ